MLRVVRIALVIISVCGAAVVSHAQVTKPCPGYDPANNTNLACEIATASRSQAQDAATLSSISATLATQLSQLPIAASASGSGVTIGSSGLPTVSSEGLGTILTQRGTTLGRHKYMFSFNFQRFGFQSVDGISLKNLPVVVNYDTTKNNIYLLDLSEISFRVNQFTALATYGLTSKIDVSFIVPFSQVDLATATHGTLHTVVGSSVFDSQVNAKDPLYLPGSATGIGDIRVNVKANVFGGEGKTAVAVGGEMRFPTGDAVNYLGTGAYGFKPYFILSHRGRFTPNVNIGYQWNGGSVLNFDQNLPSSLLYSGGADFRVVKRLTLSGEFLGQYVINAPRLRIASIAVPLPSANPGRPTPCTSSGCTTVQSFKGSYAMDNVALGFKLNPFKGLILSGSALIKLDDAGLRSTIVPLLGVAYRF